ncbi:MAG: hypothetical protein HND51_22345 [Chloroflexi bacterium]|nr:hypothetical protein [Chloroflexota bacterium]
MSTRIKTAGKYAFTALVFVLLITACSGSDPEGDVSDADRVLTQAAEIASSGLTQTAEAAPPVTDTPIPPPSETPTLTVPTDTVIPTNALNITVTEDGGETSGDGSGPPTATQPLLPSPTAQQQTSDKGCYRANLEYEFPSDGFDYPQGKVFTKEWRLKNVGTCTWRPTFRLVWMRSEFNGEKSEENVLMGTDSNIKFTDLEIPPNQYANIEVTFIAPSKDAGNYRLFYMIRTDDGVLFGLGPEGKAWFWIDIDTYVVEG